MSIICRDVSVGYGDTSVLDGIDLCVAAGESVAVMSPSGTGKTTLLGCITGLLRPTRGTVEIDGVAMSSDARQRAELRRKTLGLLFQSAELLDELSILDNVAMPQIFDGIPRHRARADARSCLRSVGLEDVADRRIDEISGGQAQRVALARALSKPGMRALVADEPTASLDHGTAMEVTHLLVTHVRDRGGALLLATHDQQVAAQCDRVEWLPDLNRVAQAATC